MQVQSTVFPQNLVTARFDFEGLFYVPKIRGRLDFKDGVYILDLTSAYGLQNTTENRPALLNTIDIIDYVNGIGNCSREQYTLYAHSAL